MSIHNIPDKIKGSYGIDKFTIMYLLVIGTVGIACFGLGRLSVHGGVATQNGILIQDKVDMPLLFAEKETQRTSGVNREPIPSSYTEARVTEHTYVASKNGKLYYTATCSGAKRISPRNEVWFASRQEAEKAGFTASPSCK